jgi:hypothetical protein
MLEAHATQRLCRTEVCCVPAYIISHICYKSSSTALSYSTLPLIGYLCILYCTLAVPMLKTNYCMVVPTFCHYLRHPWSITYKIMWKVSTPLFSLEKKRNICERLLSTICHFYVKSFDKIYPNKKLWCHLHIIYVTPLYMYVSTRGIGHRSSIYQPESWQAGLACHSDS